MSIEFYTDASGAIRWRVKARNGRVVADSGQGYSRMIDARRGLILATGFRISGDTGRRPDRFGDAEYADVRDLRQS